MIQKIQVRCLIAIVVLALSATAAQAVNIETVPVGNLGNANDTRYEMSGYGGVDYAYNIGKYEVTAGQYCEFLNAVAATDNYGLYNSEMDSNLHGCQITQNGNNGSYTYDFSGGTVEAPGSTASDWANRPVNLVSWSDAARFANWLHNGQGSGDTENGSYALNGATSNAALMAISRESDATWVIPTEDEWYKAAYHKNNGDTDNYFDYPTSSDTAPGRDMTEDTNPCNNANYYGDPWPIDSPYYMTVVGEFENSESPYGTFDQGGNVWEWNETADYATSSRSLRGGPFSTLVDTLRACYRGDYYQTSDGPHIGFRVASVPEPGSITLFVYGLVTGLIWWWRRRR